MKNANTPERLAQQQISFAAHIRDPHHIAAPDGIEDRRMQIYRRLFFNNILNLLSSNFPVLRKLYDETSWKQLVRDFYTEHQAHTPLFPEFGKEFLRYIQENREPRSGDPPFMLELAHYEWVELALSLDSCDLDATAANPHGHLLDEPPVLSPLAWPLSYQYPVHQISRTFQPQIPPEKPTHLMVYRNLEDQVKFMQLNDVSRYLLATMQEQPDLSGHDLLMRVAQHIDHADPSALLTFGLQLLNDWKERDVILGTRPCPSAVDSS